MRSKIEWYGDNAIVSTDDVSFTFQTVDNPRDLDTARNEKQALDWINQSYQVENYTVFPYGSDDNLPKTIKDVVQNNYIAPGILKKKTQLVWGKGPKLYKESFKDGVLVRDWLDHSEINSWLESWDAETYLLKCAVDFHYMETSVTQFYEDRGARLGRATKIAKLEHLNINDSRKAKLTTAKSPKPTHCLFSLNKNKQYQSDTSHAVYPLFDFLNPFKHKTPVFFSNMYSFCSDYHTVPDLYGSLEWLRRSTAIPLLFKALSENGMSIKYHIISPQAFWDAKKKELEDAATQEKPYKDSDLLKFRTEYLRKVTEVLSGADNTGKFWHTVKYVEVDGNNILEHGWEIKEIKQNIKDFVLAQVKIDNQAKQAVAAGVGMHQALGGSGEGGKSDSGSEQLYALKNFLQTGIDIPEMIICKALNYAIKANWPGTGIKVGFYHIAPQREEDISSKERTKEQV